jgi:hypothetical protein
MLLNMSTHISDKTQLLDRAGMTASLLCAAHCALLPFVITLLPLVGLSFLTHESTELALLIVSGGLGASSLCLGYRTHGSRRALAALSVGFALMALGRFAEQNDLGFWGVAMVVLGGLTVTSAHWLNRRLCLTCRTC